LLEGEASPVEGSVTEALEDLPLVTRGRHPRQREPGEVAPQEGECHPRCRRAVSLHEFYEPGEEAIGRAQVSIEGDGPEPRDSVRARGLVCPLEVHLRYPQMGEDPPGQLSCRNARQPEALRRLRDRCRHVRETLAD